MSKISEKILLYWRYFISLGIFILLYIIGILLPLELTPHYYNYMSRVWNWTELLILLLAVYYIIKARIFQWKHAAMALILGTVCLVSLFRDPRTADMIVTSVCTAVTFYAACRLYELADAENPGTLLEVLKEEKVGKVKGGIYHKVQIELTYNSNHIEGTMIRPAIFTKRIPSVWKTAQDKFKKYLDYFRVHYEE